MPTRFGADGGFASTTSGGVFDSSGNPIVSADNEFGAAPLGPAALAQTLFSVPNGTFNILPPDIDIPISNENPLPYWSSPVDNSDGEMIAQVVYNTTSNTYSLRMDPGSALSGDTLSITTRSAVLSDDNLSLRQKAIATLEKVGTYAGTTQVNLKLDATYYDHTGTQISTNPIGTVFDNGTVSSLAEFTTAGTAIVGISAAYVDLTFTMTATANVTSGIAFDIDTILLQTSQGGGGGGGAFLITETFTSSGTFNVPTGVEYVTVVAIGGGGGGGGGQMVWATSSLFGGAGSGGGGGSRIVIARDIPLGTATSVSVGIGAGGAGGAGGTVNKTTGGTAHRTAAGTNGSDGAATTFGSYLSVPGGGGGGAAGTTTTIGSGGAVAGVATATVLEVNQYLGGTGSNGGTPGTATGTAAAVGAGGVSGTAATRGMDPVSYFTILGNIGSAGGSATSTTTNAIAVRGTPATPGTTTNYFLEGGGGGSGANSRNSPGTPIIGTASAGGAGGGGAGGGICCAITSALGTVTLTAGNGGAAGANTGAGGGAGGLVKVDTGTTGGFMDGSRGTAIGGTGGSGGSGLLTVVYIG
jgi:hypothetical protein